MSVFLEPEDVALLTGIKRGRNGQSRDELQADQLRQMGVPFYLNAARRPIVARAAVEGGQVSRQEKSAAWQPAVLQRR